MKIEEKKLQGKKIITAIAEVLTIPKFTYLLKVLEELGQEPDTNKCTKEEVDEYNSFKEFALDGVRGVVKQAQVMLQMLDMTNKQVLNNANSGNDVDSLNLSISKEIESKEGKEDA